MNMNCEKRTPITLIGKTLGERHRYFNSLINKEYEREKEYRTLDGFQDDSPIDRIFNINLASKFQNIDYIIENLKHDDMLYVSKSLRCKWLLECKFEHIINPQYLEENLYPLMITTAVTKMKHWVLLNLKVEERCQHFFSYYYEKNNLEHAIKFLRKCSPSFIEEQFPNVIHNISPKDFKILIEKNHEVAKIFFDSLATDEEIKAKYLGKEKYYFNTLKLFLKIKPDVVLNFTEKYFNATIMQPFSPKATKLIMKYHKERYLRKPELYTSWLLDIKTLACCFNAEEAMNLMLILARDKYLTTTKWFNYKKVEPLIKRLKPEDRGAFKKKVFVDKDIGNESTEWLYPKPSPPIINENTKESFSIFEDREHHPNEYNNLRPDFRAMLKKRKYAKWAEFKSEKTELDKLFDQYRVASFDKTLFELRKRIKAESSSQIRQYMMLVLVSKSGGREANIVALMQLLIKFVNEPPQLRAAIVRSLVKRAYVWRIPDETWKQFLEFAHGLGLDGNTPEADCTEVIHAVIIRQMMMDQKCDPKIFAIYLDEFSTLTEYSLLINEKATISVSLPKILFTYVCNELSVSQAVNLINKFLDTLTAYKVSVNSFPDLIPKIKSLAAKDICDASPILKRLFEDRTARLELFKENFKLIESEDMYLNALRHDTEVLSTINLIKLILKKDATFIRFFRKIFIYFNEENGLAKTILNALKLEAYHNALAKPLTLLLGEDLESYLKNLDNSVVDKNKTFTAFIRSNVHLAKPALDIDSFGWLAIGTKAIANKVLICRDVDIYDYTKKLLQSKRTVKLCLILAKRKGDFTDTFTTVAKMKPTVAIKYGLKILKSHKDLSNLEVWDIIKPLLENQDITSKSKIYQRITDVASLPIQIRPAYSIIMYNAFKTKLFLKSMPFLCHIETLLPNVKDEYFIENLLQNFLNDFLPNKKHCEYDYVKCDCLFIRILVKYLLLCKSQSVQKERLETIGALFFKRMEALLLSDRFAFTEYLDEMMGTFKYHKVFLNMDYVSCMPVMERVLTWMKTILSVEKYFRSYVHMQLNMLYFTAIRKSIDNLSNHCIDESNREEATKIVGSIFGQYIADEVTSLTTKYFDSSKYLYKDVILKLRQYFFHSCEIFTVSLINGIIDQSNTDNILCIYLLKERRSCLKKHVWKEILGKILEKGNIETQMVSFAEM